MLEFTDTNLSAILDFLGDAGGINLTSDADFEDEPASLGLTNVTFEKALVHLLSSHGAFYKVLNPTTSRTRCRSARRTTSRRFASSTSHTATSRSWWRC